jgi:hypothetical protein
MINNNLLGGFNLPTPLKKYESTSMGRMTYPIYIYEMENQIHVPKHQAVELGKSVIHGSFRLKSAALFL